MSRKLKTSLVFTILLGLLVLCSACTSKSDLGSTSAQTKIILGYCPTMAPDVQMIKKAYPDLTAIQIENSALALQALKRGEVDAVLIGRRAREFELGESTQLVRIRDGYTLLGIRQGSIRYDDLKLLTIRVVGELSEAHAMLPEGTRMLTYPNLDQAYSDLDEESALFVRWSQVLPEHHLLIPVDHQGNKVPDFRSPHIYYLDEMEDNLSFLFNDRWD